MRVAVPLFGSRVSPRCIIAREMLLAEVRGRRVETSVSIPIRVHDEEDFAERLLDLGVDLIVCGGIRRELSTVLTASGIKVISNVAGEVMEVLDCLRRGRLIEGHGLSSTPAEPDPAASPGEPVAGDQVPEEPDCVACVDRSCVEGGGCRFSANGLLDVSIPAEEAQIAEVAKDVSAEADPKLCRIAELVHFALGMGYERIGLAFCWELFRETEILTPVLARFFTVVPVCCRFGSAEKPGADGASAGADSVCNPILQAAVLERARTDLNVLVGACMGSDLLFTAHSHAPVTTLFVKDRTLAHNPVGAIYTRYHLEALKRAGSSSFPAGG